MTRTTTARARLFVAVDPPAPVCTELAAWARTALGPSGGRRGASGPLRVLDPRLLHVTLCFLGDRPLEEVEAIAAALAQSARAVGELSIGAPLWLPPRRPRTLAVEVRDEDGELERLHCSVSETVAAATGWLEDGVGGARGTRRRRFRPHVTLARMREGAAPRSRELAPTPALCFTPAEVVLYRSWLSPQGASYEALASVALVP